MDIEIKEIFNFVDNIVNPWTFLLFILFVFLRKEIKEFLNSINEHFSELSGINLKIKDVVEITTEKKSKLMQKISNLSHLDVSNIIGESISEKNFQTWKNLILDNMSEDDMGNFLSLFGSVDTVVLKEDMIYNSVFNRLSKFDIVKKASVLPAVFKSMPVETRYFARLRRVGYSKNIA